MKNLEKDKIVVRQFKDGSSNFWSNYTHYFLNENNELIWCSGETDKEELRNAVFSFIRRNKKSYKARPQTVFETEEKEYTKIGFGKCSQMTTMELVATDKKYASWLYKNCSDNRIKTELKELLKIK